MKDCLKFQYVVGVPNPETGVAEFIPAVRPPSAEAGWFAQQVGLITSSVQTPDDMAAWHSKVKKVLSVLISNEGIPVHFERHAWRQEVEWRMSNKWDWKPIAERGYFVGIFWTRRRLPQSPIRIGRSSLA